MFRTVVRRWRETEAMLHQSEKMVQLGTLTAGVAHELNNPASAVRRSVVRMAEALAVYVRSPWPKAVADAGLRERMLERALDASTHPKVMDSLARSDLESQLTEGLRIAGVRDGSILAGALVGMGYDTAQIAKLGAEVGGRELEAVVSWLSATYTLQVLAREAGEAAGRIAEIVKALGAYTYLDRAPLQTVDVREGLENTLLILGHKLGGIQVLREYDPGLPSIQAYGNELNQVWTNILDNAADALGGSGCIRIRARPEADTIVVEIADDGPGVPPEARERVFDAFYTTKPPGRGTGLGLHISYNIVVARHGGDIRLESRPGNTCFRIRLPVLGPH
jgi:signal transduction histidine kinase